MDRVMEIKFYQNYLTINLVSGFPWAMESWSFKEFLVTLQILKGSLWGEMLTPNLATLETFLLSQIHFSFSVWVMSRTTHVQESWWSPNPVSRYSRTDFGNIPETVLYPQSLMLPVDFILTIKIRIICKNFRYWKAMRIKKLRKQNVCAYLLYFL